MQKKNYHKTVKFAKRPADMTDSELAAAIMIIPCDRDMLYTNDEWANLGVGAFLNILDSRAIEEFQKKILDNGNPPAFFCIDAPKGHSLSQVATILPSQFALAATFNRELIKKAGELTAIEMATNGLHVNFSPNCDRFAKISFCRGGETSGSEPYWIGEVTESLIRGYHGTNLSDKLSVLSAAKHFIGYGIDGEDGGNCDVSMHFLRNELLPSFEKAIKAGCKIIMTGFNPVNYVPMAINRTMLSILRKELNFEGIVITDWDTVKDLIRQGVAKDVEEATLLCIMSGHDMIMSTPESHEAILNLLKTGRLDRRYLEDAVQRILTLKELSGLFENPYKTGIPGSIGCQEHHQTAKDIARETVILLSNERVGNKRALPLGNDVRKIGVFGKAAEIAEMQFGDWLKKFQLDFLPVEEFEQIKEQRDHETLLTALTEIGAQKAVEVKYAPGYNIVVDKSNNSTELLQEAIALSEDVDVRILGLAWFPFYQTGEGRNNPTGGIPEEQEMLFQALRKSDKPLITVLYNQPGCTNAKTESDAFLLAPNGGLYGGRAIAEVLFGLVNPSGKLPIADPFHVGQNSDFNFRLRDLRTRDEGYVNMTDKPYRPYGFGLSFTQFEYSNLQAYVEGETVFVTVEVTNIGDVRGKEVTQVYFEDPVSSVMTHRRMIGVEKIDLDAGEKETVCFKLEREAFALNIEGKWVVESGKYIIMVGGNSQDCERLTAEITLS